MTFYSFAALLYLSSSHLCAETMTVQVACSAGCPGGTSSPCWGTITPTQRNEQGCSLGARLPGRPTPLLRHLPPFVRQGQGTKCWVIHIKLSGWKRLQMLLFLCLVLSPRSVFSLSPASRQRWLPGRFGVWVFKKLKKRGLWKRSWGLGSCTSWIGFFFLFSLPLQPKVQSKQSEVNGFIFSYARQFVHNREPLLFVLFTINANIY